MPYYTEQHLRDATLALEAARRDPQAHFCHAPRRNAAGDTARPLKVRKDVVQDVPYGPHGVAFLAIDLETREIVCGVCTQAVQDVVK